jgi:hypothetical protein
VQEAKLLIGLRQDWTISKSRSATLKPSLTLP